ncbi:putative Mandelate racemase/muconate lactonizing enzyme family; chloromuconate cycloisomerase [uncultured Paludibacter sp.]|nr:putative Mandelate racemase/muconate lactonizing enzyme family; chloromuconate cycloisomerase [uncultured Paludibacter sp.]
MVISSIDIFKSPIKLKEPFVISLGPLEYAQNVVVVIHTDDGLIGYGECSPFMTINGESMDTGFVVGQYLAQALKGENPLNISHCTNIMDKTIYGNASIKSAFDIALYDIASQHANLPLYKFLGGEKNKTIHTDYTVSLGSPEKMVKDAISIKQRGFQVVKVKLGDSKDADVNRIRLIRESIGYEIPLRIDANQGWNDEETPDILKELEPYNIQLCEEPIPRWNFMALPKIREKSSIPIMADESCCTSYDAERLLQIRACDMFNIKLGKSGGIFDALKIIEIAKKQNTIIQIGGFLESRLAFTASAHLALTSHLIQYFDFDTPLMFIEDPVVGGISYGANGKVTVPETPGLGAKMDDGYLNSLEKVTI